MISYGIKASLYIYDYLDMKSILEQLSSMTVVDADTGDLDSIKKFQPRDATTNPSLILAAAKNPDYVKLIDKALESSENALPQGFSEIELIRFPRIPRAMNFVNFLKLYQLISHNQDS